MTGASMLLKQKNGLLFFQFNNLAGFSDLCHGIFTRHDRSDKNEGRIRDLRRDENDENHAAMQRHVVDTLCGDQTQLVFLKQVHQADIVVLTESNSAPHQNRGTLTGDGLVTNIRGKVLGIRLADCQAILIYDPQKQVIANVHSGWRGSLGNIIGRCITSMRDAFGCRPENIVAGISPSLGPCCAEFKNDQTEVPSRFHEYHKGSAYFDFWQITRDQLIESGVLPENIELSGMCTKCNPHLFFSYRHSGAAGRFIAVIGLKNPSAEK